MVLSTTFNKISVILWWSVLLLEETEVPRENHPPATSHCIRNNNLIKSSEVQKEI
jgi:hypothetical protein